MEELWKDITGYDYLYQISNKGRVKSLAKTWGTGNNTTLSKPDTLMKGSPSGSGYKRVGLTLNGKSRPLLIHRLVAMAFIPNPENKPCVNHKNGIKSDNRLENLEWCTYSENTIHAFKTGLSKATKGDKHHLRKDSSKSAFYGKSRGESNKAKKVINIDTGKIYDCMKDCAEENNINYKTLIGTLSLNKKNKTPFRFLNAIAPQH